MAPPTKLFPDLKSPAFGDGVESSEFRAARKLALSADRVLRLSRAFSQAGRPVDLTGLNLVVGRLTASVLDLDLPESRRLRPDLLGLLDSLDRLELSLAAMAPDEGAYS